MNLDDLTRELEVHATAPSPPIVGPARLAGVRQRIRTRRRRQAGAAAGLTALAVASVILVPGLTGRQAVPAPAPAPAGTPRPTDPLSFTPDVAGDPLIAQAVGKAGGRELVLRFTPTDTNLALSDFCRLPGKSALDDTPATLSDTTVNGHALTGNDCAAEHGANQSSMTFHDDPEINRARWAEVDLVPGRESVVRMTVRRGKGSAVDLSAVRLGVGLYVLSGERVEDAGVRIKVQAEADGHRYRLAGHTTALPAAEHPRLSLPVPADDHPVLVLFGNPGDPTGASSGGTAMLWVDGREESGNSGGGTGTQLLNDAGAHTLELRLDPGMQGTMVLAYYVRSD